MIVHPTTVMLLAHERRRDLERAAAVPAHSPVWRPKRLGRILRRTAPALSRASEGGV